MGKPNIELLVIHVKRISFFAQYGKRIVFCSIVQEWSSQVSAIPLIYHRFICN